LRVAARLCVTHLQRTRYLPHRFTLPVTRTWLSDTHTRTHTFRLIPHTPPHACHTRTLVLPCTCSTYGHLYTRTTTAVQYLPPFALTRYRTRASTPYTLRLYIYYLPAHLLLPDTSALHSALPTLPGATFPPAAVTYYTPHRTPLLPFPHLRGLLPVTAPGTYATTPYPSDEGITACYSHASRFLLCRILFTATCTCRQPPSFTAPTTPRPLPPPNTYPFWLVHITRTHLSACPPHTTPALPTHCPHTTRYTTRHAYHGPPHLPWVPRSTP